MKPNLFRSINDALTERFPILPRVRKGLYGLLFLSGLFLIMQCSNENIHVSVVPGKIGSYDSKTVVVYGRNAILLQGELIIANPTFLQKVLLTDTTTNLNIISLIIIGMLSIVIIRIIPKIYQHNLFRKDISASIRALGYIMIVHVWLMAFCAFYTPSIIEHLTHNAFTTHNTFPIWLAVEVYAAWIILAVASAFKRGLQLQKEQDLTV